jgi:hypothetical protein
MKSFLEFLQEGVEQHKGGTYCAALLDEKSRQNLYNWCKLQGIQGLTDPNQYHVTLIYSRKPCAEIEEYPFYTPWISDYHEGRTWQIFGSKKNTKCLVLKLRDMLFYDVHDEIREIYGATHDYEKYSPHITVSYDFKGDLKTLHSVPEFDLTFDKIEVKPLDVDYLPK